MEAIVNEALRYLGVRSPADAALRSQLVSLADAFSARITPRSTWCLYPLQHVQDGVFLNNILLSGRSAAKMLADCDRCALMICTLGLEFDMWLRQLQARDMSQAVMLDALGSALIERVCDSVEQEIAKRFPEHYLTDRFSPGYGDLPLTLQPALLAAADGLRIGVNVTDSCLLLPQKSVTALVGIAKTPQAARIRGCAACTMRKTCTLRKAGMTCDL